MARFLPLARLLGRHRRLPRARRRSSWSAAFDVARWAGLLLMWMPWPGPAATRSTPTARGGPAPPWTAGGRPATGGMSYSTLASTSISTSASSPARLDAVPSYRLALGPRPPPRRRERTTFVSRCWSKLSASSSRGRRSGAGRASRASRAGRLHRPPRGLRDPARPPISTHGGRRRTGVPPSAFCPWKRAPQRTFPRTKPRDGARAPPL
jgi:hypothetical protein